MIVIDNVLVGDDIIEKQFVCDLSKCRGGCCEDGDAGAPLEDEELDMIVEVVAEPKPKPQIRVQLGTRSIFPVETRGG